MTENGEQHTDETRLASDETSHHAESDLERIGPYRIIEKIGEGGFGEVYSAEQTEPVKRRVAVKILKAGMDTKAVLARFEAERQALALMEHPSIAKVWDAGETERGRPYFVLEYIQGESIMSYAKRNRLTTHQRLELFLPVCEAIQHAHQKAVIHRDIKPSNILVTDQHGRAVPKIIDFGVAKALAAPLTERTLYTEAGQLIGTPAYMSPEQADLKGQNVDTRTDVYSLGAVLYELLVGEQPFDAKDLRKMGLSDVCRLLREVDPPKPSTRVLSQAGDFSTLSKIRKATVRAHMGELQGDLDWITMKALEKDRVRRYQSATDLARDIERHLRNEPVEAAAPGGAYRLRKFVIRHRGPFTFVAALFVLLVGFGVWMSILYTKANTLREEAQARAEDLAVVTEFQASMLSRINAEEMGQALFTDLRERVRESLESQQVSSEEMESTLEAFDQTLAKTNPTNVALELVDEQVLDRAAETIDEEFADQPLIQAALQQTIAETYVHVGLYPQAVPLQQQALDTRRRILGDDDPETLSSLNTMGMISYEMGKLDEALGYFRISLEGNRRAFGDRHPTTLAAINNMGGLLNAMGRLEEASRYFSEALEGGRAVEGDDHPSTLMKINNMGGLLYQMGKYDESLALYREAVEGRRRVLGDDNPRTLTSIGNMGRVLTDMGKHEEALVNTREALEGRRRVLGDEHPSTMASVNNMALLLYEMGQLDEALGYFKEALEGNRRALGDTHPRTVMTIDSMGALLLDQGKAEEAIALLGPAAASVRQAFPGGKDRRLAILLTGLGRARTQAGEFVAAVSDLNEAHSILLESPRARKSDREMALTGLVDLYEAWHAAEPDQGHDRKVAEWQTKLAESREPTSPE